MEAAAAAPLTQRRVHSELSFRIPDEINLLLDVDSPTNNNINNNNDSNARDDHQDEHDLLASYMDMENIEGPKFPDVNDNGNEDAMVKLRHSGSVDAFSGTSVDNDDDHHQHHDNNSHSYNDNIHTNVKKKNRIVGCEAKKAMSPDKLAELWVVDPKRAKRILANRQSAARSKERKARYIVELEKRVQSLQTEATALSVQLSLFERDTTGLTRENTELRRQLESMEQQAQLRDALNDALKQELDRLKVATGESTAPSDPFMVPTQSMPFNNTQQPQPGLVEHRQSKPLPLYSFESKGSKMPYLHSYEPNLTNHNQPIESYEANMISLPKPSKSQQLYPQFSTVESRMPGFPHQCDSSLGHVPQYHFDPNIPGPQQQAYVASQSHLLAPISTQDHLSRLQGFSIKVEGPTIVASGSMGGF